MKEAPFERLTELDRHLAVRNLSCMAVDAGHEGHQLSMVWSTNTPPPSGAFTESARAAMLNKAQDVVLLASDRISLHLRRSLARPEDGAPYSRGPLGRLQPEHSPSHAKP